MHFSLSLFLIHTHTHTPCEIEEQPAPASVLLHLVARHPACTRLCVCVYLFACVNVSECRSKTVMRANFITSVSSHSHTHATTCTLSFSQPLCGSAEDTGGKHCSCTQTQKHLTSMMDDYLLLPSISTT